MFSIDLQKLILIKRYGIKYENVRNLTICYDGKNEAELKYIDATIYPSKLESFAFRLSKNCDLEARNDFSLESFQNLKTLNTENCFIDIQDHMFYNHNFFTEVLILFEKACTFRFMSCTFKECEDNRVPSLKEVQCKFIAFVKCSYNSSKILKDVLSNVVSETDIESIEFSDIFEKDSKLIDALKKKLTDLNDKIEYVKGNIIYSEEE